MPGRGNSRSGSGRMFKIYEKEKESTNEKYRISYRCLSIFLMVLFVITSLSVPVMAAEAQAAEFETV